jgi:hypothetical protein
VSTGCADHDERRRQLRLRLSNGGCAMFVRDIDSAFERAEASYAPEIWQTMSASERSAAMYRELRALDAQSIKDGNYVPLPRLRRSP